MSFLSDYTEKNSNLIPQIDIPCFAWNSQAEQGFLFFKAKSLPFWGLPFLFTPPINGSILKNLGNQERYNIADRLVYHVNNKRMFP